ncbi:hypothetical protein [Marinobacter sp. Arc7-DN-1]|uniref:hypothetical protein n=1 Tax=Marinobacter sp. Arc7-DN-1 TaxID=2304594 RepID=UPI000E452357|nr:hypothetical protein [Marinobacter sp. Arc7-DN-1]AXS83257.1 hypothetical protein D0851_09520 [Marinobacter sp. Arc7-DN-1]
MAIEQLKKRYANHPLGTALQELDKATDINMLHRVYISAKTMVLLLKYQTELTESEAKTLDEYIESRITVFQPGGNQSNYS